MPIWLILVGRPPYRGEGPSCFPREAWSMVVIHGSRAIVSGSGWLSTEAVNYGQVGNQNPQQTVSGHQAWRVSSRVGRWWKAVEGRLEGDRPRWNGRMIPVECR